MNQTQSNKKGKKTPYVGFDKSERIFPSLFISLGLPFSLLFFGPFEMFAANESQLNFAFGDFIWPLLFAAVLLSVGIFFALRSLKGRVFDITYGILAGVMIMLFLQSSFLNLNINALPGDGVGISKLSPLATVVNTVVWVLVVAAVPVALSFLGRFRDIGRLVLMLATVAVIFGQLMNFAITSLATPVLSSVSDRREAAEESEDDTVEKRSDESAILTTQNITTLSENGNVILFIVDRFDLDYYDHIVKKEPDFFSELDGFTLYDNHISKYARTYPGVAYMLTGKENDFAGSLPSYLNDAYRTGKFLPTLKEAGYDINLYIADYYGYDDASAMDDYVSNTSSAKGYTIHNRLGLSLAMLRLSLFRQLPALGKGMVGQVSTSMYKTFVDYDSDAPLYTTDMKDVYTALTKEPFTLKEDAKGFVCMHIDGCHTDFKYDEEWNDYEPQSGDYANGEVGLRTSFIIINHYIREMKRLGVYEDATIIITGDHAAAWSDTKDLSGTRLTTLLVKKKGDSGTPISVNSAPVSHDNLHATILSSEGIAAAKDFGLSVFDVKETESGLRYYCFQKTITGKNDEIVVYEVTGDAKIFSNWKIVERIEVTGRIS